MNFKDYQFSEQILAQIQAQGYVNPTPIQAQAIPHVLAGKDVMGLAQTGTGKTAAFALPLLQRLLTTGQKGKIRGLIIAPTRELAQQIYEAILGFSKNTDITSTTIYGGVRMNPQINALRRGADIVVACPGRLLDHVGQRTIDLSGVECLVLDEADHMFDMGFLPAVREILTLLPKQRQNLLFSATMPPSIRQLANAILKNPVTVEVAHTRPVEAITHTGFAIKQHLKTALLLALLKQTPTQSILIFTRTKHRAKSLDKVLQKNGFRSASIQGNLSQNKRQAALDGFRDGKFDIMVATDIAARGIDVSQVSHVIHYDMPDTAEAYTHRSGRTGRASRTGDAYSFITHEDADIVRMIERKSGQTMKMRTLEEFDYTAQATHDPEFSRPPRSSQFKRSPSSSSRPGQHSSQRRFGSGNASKPAAKKAWYK